MEDRFSEPVAQSASPVIWSWRWSVWTGAEWQPLPCVRVSLQLRMRRTPV